MFMPISQTIALLPLLILMTGIFLLTLSIIFKRNHFFVFLMTLLTLLCTLIVLFFIYDIIPISVTSLLYINFYSLAYIFIIIFTSILIIFISYFFLEKVDYYKEEFYILILCSIIGSIILIESDHIFSILLGMELMSFPVFGLMTYLCKKNSIISVILKYLLFSCITTSFSLLGMALIYLVCGSLKLNYIKIAFLMNDISINKILLIGIVCLFISFFFKLSLFPFHFWISDFYKSISPVVLMYSTTVIKVSVFASLIHLFIFFPYEECQPLYFIIEIASISSIIFGSIMTAFQNNIKKFFGYSSIVHMGYVLTTVLTVKNYYIANNISLLYFINYIISSVGIFSILSLIVLYNAHQSFNLNTLSIYDTFLKSKSILSFSVFVIIFSFLGLPLTYGFFTKFFIIFNIIQEKLWCLLFFIIIHSGFSIYYYLKIIFNVYNTKSVVVEQQTHVYQVIECFIIAISLIIILLGIFPQIIMHLLKA